MIFFIFVLLLLISTPVLSKFGRLSTGKSILEYYAKKENIETKNLLSGRTYIVTGGNAGIGLETCKVLAYGGGRVILCSRSIRAGEDAIKNEIDKPGWGNYSVDSSNIVVRELDLSSIDSIKKFAKNIYRTEKSIDVLILNAGIMSVPQLIRTQDLGIEKQMAVNHFGHAALTRLLLPILKNSRKKSRIIFLSSSAHRFGNKNVMKDLYANNYIPWIRYGQSKLANLLYAKGISNYLYGTGFSKINAVSVHPGVITSTQLFKQSMATRIFSLLPGDRNMVQGAASTIWASISDEIDNNDMRGAYITNCKKAVPNANGRDLNLVNEVFSITENILDQKL